MSRAHPLRRTLRRADDLVEAGLIEAGERAAIERVAAEFGVAVSPAMADLIDPDDPDDPIALQFVPSASELETLPEERADPIGDRAHMPVEGVVHRYPDRVLLTPLHICPVYCRYCFRRETVGDGAKVMSGEALEAACAYIAEQPAIREVILSGGDPLMLSPARLGALVAALDRIEHVRVLRVHTRVPAAAPERITPALVAALRGSDKAVWVVLHANHPCELTEDAAAACARLIDAGMPMLAQSVLLAGVIDDAATLAALMRRLVELRIKPYYLHHPDLARGTARFRLPIARGRALMRNLRGAVSGLCQPTYVLDIPGGHGKVPIGPVWAEETSDGWRVRDPFGGEHSYAPSAERCGAPAELLGSAAGRADAPAAPPDSETNPRIER